MYFNDDSCGVLFAASQTSKTKLTNQSTSDPFLEILQLIFCQISLFICKSILKLKFIIRLENRDK